MSVAEYVALAVCIAAGGACVVGIQRVFASLRAALGLPINEVRARAIADAGALLAVCVVALIGVLVIVGPAVRYAENVFDDPSRTEIQTETTTVSKSTPGADGALVENARVTTTKEVPRSRSLLDRAFGPGGLLLARLALMAMAAFLAGAVTQRVLMGTYDIEIGPSGVTLGPLEKSVAQQGSDAIRLTDRIEKIETESAQRLATIDQIVEELSFELRDTKVSTSRAVRELVGLLEEVRLSPLERSRDEPPSAPRGPGVS